MLYDSGNSNRGPVSTLRAGIGREIGRRVKRGRDWGQEQKGATEDERAGWHH